MIVLVVLVLLVVVLLARRHGRKNRRKDSADVLAEVLGLAQYKGRKWREYGDRWI